MQQSDIPGRRQTSPVKQCRPLLASMGFATIHGSSAQTGRAARPMGAGVDFAVISGSWAAVAGQNPEGRQIHDAVRARLRRILLLMQLRTQEASSMGVSRSITESCVP